MLIYDVVRDWKNEEVWFCASVPNKRYSDSPCDKLAIFLVFSDDDLLLLSARCGLHARGVLIAGKPLLAW